jgi:glutathione S-transferase
LLEELQIPYDLKIFKRNKAMQAGAELKQIHPLGKSPVISIELAGNPNPVVLAESGLIVEYLIEHFGPHLIPKRYMDGKEGQVGGETESWLRDRYFTHYTEGSLMALMLIQLMVRSEASNPPLIVSGH